VHTFLAFFAWPDGGVWGNVIAMPLCGLAAAFSAFVFRDRIGRALKDWHHRHFGHHAELDAIRERLDGHADALNLGTPGGLAAVMDETRRAVSASEAALAEVRALIAISGPRQAPRRGATPMQKKATGKADDR
jgi:hypothetical protein